LSGRGNQKTKQQTEEEKRVDKIPKADIKSAELETRKQISFRKTLAKGEEARGRKRKGEGKKKDPV